jgi:hypothetical protein
MITLCAVVILFTGLHHATTLIGLLFASRLTINRDDLSRLSGFSMASLPANRFSSA